ncbi:unnamed protein product, partial [Musa textilis]
VSTGTKAFLCLIAGERGGASCQNSAGQGRGSRQPRGPGGAPSTAGRRGGSRRPKAGATEG